MKKNYLIGGSILIVLIALAVVFATSGGFITTGEYSSKSACETQSQKLLDGAYVACTGCSTTYSRINGYYAAGCFLSGTKGEQCIKAGGTCSDTSCTTCNTPQRTCYEKETRVVDGDVGDKYRIDNWGDVCDKTVYELKCISGYKVSGYSISTSLSGLGTCNVVNPTPPNPTCTPRYSDSCDMSDGCGGSRSTQGNSCGDSGSYCMSGACANPCADKEATTCEDTSYFSNPTAVVRDAGTDAGTVVCVYQSVEINSEQCGYEAPTVEDDQGNEVPDTTDHYDPAQDDPSDPIVDEELEQGDIDGTGVNPSWWDNFVAWLKSLFSY